MTDESLLEWASDWLRDAGFEDPTFRQRFTDGLTSELNERRLERVSLSSERDRLALDAGISTEILEEVANGTTSPTRASIESRRAELYEHSKTMSPTRQDPPPK